MRVVLDSNILVRAAVSGTGPARECLLRIEAGAHLLITSEYILEEIQRVLTYPHLQARWDITKQDIREFVQELRIGSVVVNPSDYGQEGIVTDDPDDDPIVTTVVVGQAEILCTLDKHLQTSAVREYLAERGVEVLTDVQLLERLRRSSAVA